MKIEKINLKERNSNFQIPVIHSGKFVPAAAGDCCKLTRLFLRQMDEVKYFMYILYFVSAVEIDLFLFQNHPQRYEKLDSEGKCFCLGHWLGTWRP